MSNPHRNNPRGKNSAMLRRLRSGDAGDEEDDTSSRGGNVRGGNQGNQAPAAGAADQAAAGGRGDEAAAGNNDQGAGRAGDNQEEEEGDPLPRLIARLRREHAANFAGSGGSVMAACGHVGHAAQNFTLRPADIDRARYLLEATAGNVGLASWLYWEDYLSENLAGAGGLGAGNPAGVAGGGPGGPGRGDDSSRGEGVLYEAAVAEGYDPKLNDYKASSLKRGELKRSTGQEGKKRKYDESDQDGKQSDDESDNQSDEEAAKPPSKKPHLETDHRSDGSASPGAEEPEAQSPHVARSNNLNLDAPPPPAAARRRLNAHPAVQQPINQNQLAQPQGLQPGPGLGGGQLQPVGFGAGRAQGQLQPGLGVGVGGAQGQELNQDLLDLEAFLIEINRQNRVLEQNVVQHYGPGALAQFLGQGLAAAQGLGGQGFGQGQVLQGLGAGLLGAQGQGQGLVQGLRGELGGQGLAGGLDLGALVQGLGLGNLNPHISELLLRIFQGRQLNEEESRALIAALGEVPVDAGQGRAAAAAGGVAAAAGGVAAAGAGGGGDDDGDDSHNGSDDAQPDEDHHGDDGFFDWNEPFANLDEPPLRRSGRLREQRNRRRRAHAHHHARPNNDGGASVSDDDGDFVPGPNPVFREIAEQKSAKTGKRKKGEVAIPHHKLHENDSDDDDMSDASPEVPVNMEDFFNPTDESVHPFEILWSKTGGEDESDDEEEKAYIPRSWLRTGFALSECGNGLAVDQPSDEEFDIVRRSHSQVIREGPLKSIKGLFPYHCKGLSALLSIVTAMIYSGASIRGSTVTCDADWTPFDELTLEKRKIEFPKRLVEALSALIFLAAQSMSDRCANALATMDKQYARRKKQHNLTPEEEDEFTVNRLKMQRRVHQCRVCSWEPDTANNDAPILPHGRDPKDIRVHSSLTNIQDIKAYVRSHLRLFTEPGGCALFLETIARCHGSAYFKKLFDSDKEADAEKGDAKSAEVGKVALVGCQCKETLRYLEKRSKDKNLPDVMPDEHDCIRVELLSLLLTGQARSNYQNWSADNLGIGLLRIDKESNVGTRLLRPLKPIWICLGDFGYSTLFLDKKDFVGSENSLDDPGKAFKLAHWDCWGGERITMKVIPSMYSPPFKGDTIPAVISEMEDDSKRTVTESIVIKMEEERKRDAGNPWEGNDLYSVSTNPNLKPITDEELQSIKFHLEDENFYPKEYRRWRYNLGNGNDWVSFYRLRPRQKLIVEMKLAPRICVLVRSRWPLATVRDFMPENKFPIV